MSFIVVDIFNFGFIPVRRGWANLEVAFMVMPTVFSSIMAMLILDEKKFSFINLVRIAFYILIFIC